MECAIAMGVEAGDNTVGKRQRILKHIAGGITHMVSTHEELEIM